VKFVLVRRSVRHDPQMVRLLNEPAAQAQVTVLEHVELPVLRALYAEANLFFFPSWVEGFGIPILEAMATGTPVVTADQSAPAEVAGDAALLADPFDEVALGEALQRLDREATLRSDLIEKGRKRAAAFTWQRCAQATLDAYQRTRGHGAQ
jgi:alpha-1,3-rhamnosyl/mannosyltransferase